MTVYLSENIRKLRTERLLTQEQLSEALGVAPQTVSRWEMGKVFPDISLLPVIAGYFEVSTDELLGVDTARKNEKIKGILKENLTLRNKGETEKSIDLLRKALEDYPNDSRLLYSLAESLHGLYFQSGEEFSRTERENGANEAVGLLKKAMKYTDENFDDAGGCRQLLVYNYMALGKYEKAKETALSAPFMAACRENLYAGTLAGKAAAAEYQKNILYYTVGLYYSIYKVWQHSDYSDEQRAELFLTAERILLLIGGENSGFFNLFSCALQILKAYIKMGDREKILEYLEKAFKYAAESEERPDRTKYSVFWLCCCENNSSGIVKYSKDSLYDGLLDVILKYNLEELLGGDVRFGAVLEKIRAARE